MDLSSRLVVVLSSLALACASPVDPGDGLPARVFSVTVAPAQGDSALIVGTSVLFVATLQDSAGNPLTGRAVGWGSSNGSIASVDATGLVTARDTGTATIRATADQQTGEFVVTVVPVPAAGVAIGLPGNARPQMLAPGLLGLEVTVTDSAGATLDRPVVWTSSNTSVLTVSDAGLIRARSPGNAIVRATVGEQVDSLLIGVLASPGSISAGFAFTCALGSGQDVLCFGSNGDGGLGTTAVRLRDSFPNDGTEPVRARSTTPVPIENAERFQSVDVGFTHACALTVAGEAWCWGRGERGSLGARPDSLCGGGNPCSPTPLRVATNERFVEIEAGFDVTCARTALGAVWCWGSNSVGQLGSFAVQDDCPARDSDPGIFCSINPVEVLGLPAIRTISVGGSSVCAVAEEGDVHCWGTFGPLIGGGTARRPEPIPSWPPLSAINVGIFHSCGVTTRQEVVCTGINNAGQIGDGTNLARSTPTRIADNAAFVGVTVGGAGFVEGFSCAAILSDGARCWGRNDDGELGTSSSDVCSGFFLSMCSRTPLAIDLSTPLIVVSGGAQYACGRSLGGNAWCWGRNSSGQLGDGTTTSRQTPMPVLLP